MKRLEIMKMLERIETDLSVPVTYYSWPEKQAPPLPYAVYFYSNTRTEPADNTNHIRIVTLVIELYTKQKDFATENALEKILSDFEKVYTKDETFLNTEDMFDIIYTMEETSIWDESDTA